MTQAALVTGASGSLGTAISRMLHAQGFCVALADIDIAVATKVAQARQHSHSSMQSLCRHIGSVMWDKERA